MQIQQQANAATLEIQRPEQEKQLSACQQDKIISTIREGVIGSVPSNFSRVKSYLLR